MTSLQATRTPPSCERVQDIAGLRTTVVGVPANGGLMVVLLHGYTMAPADLSPFAHSLSVPALFLLPEGPLTSPIGGRAWWDIDLAARNGTLNDGPRDLAEIYPAGLSAARERLRQFVMEARRRFQPRRLVLSGFSQGGMLASDHTLHCPQGIDGLCLMSASRIAAWDWERLRHNVRGLPVLISHGVADCDLAFAAGERLRDFLDAAGAIVSWVPFEGGHEIPLTVWRRLRKFLLHVNATNITPETRQQGQSLNL